MKIRDTEVFKLSEENDTKAIEILDNIYDEIDNINKDIKNSVSNLNGSYDEIINFFESDSKIKYQGDSSTYNANNERDSFNVLALYENDIISPYFFKTNFVIKDYENGYFEFDNVDIISEKDYFYNFEDLDLTIDLDSLL